MTDPAVFASERRQHPVIVREVVDSTRFGVGVVESLNETMRRNQLPKLELSVFDGDALEFQQWLVSFEKIIEQNTADPAQRLHYLIQYTSGKCGNAKQLVSGYGTRSFRHWLSGSQTGADEGVRRPLRFVPSLFATNRGMEVNSALRHFIAKDLQHFLEEMSWLDAIYSPSFSAEYVLLPSENRDQVTAFTARPAGERPSTRSRKTVKMSCLMILSTLWIKSAE